MPQKTKPPLSALENTVMHIVWNHSEVTAEWVRQALASQQPMKDSTVRTILRRLETKGYVSHRAEGRTYVYQPVDGSQFVAAEAVLGIIDRFCNGSVESLLVGLVDRKIISPDRLQLLAERLATEKQKDVRATGKKKVHQKGS
jgi:BlaI family penicillinase repressor